MSGGPVVIVGAGPAGLSCARSYRRSGGAEPVILIGADPDPPYQRPPLSKELLRGESERAQLPLEGGDFYAKESIELRTGTRVTSIDPDRRTIETDSGELLDYGACVLASGSRPSRPELPGIDAEGVLTLRSISDCERLRDAVGEGTRVLVVGSGFIGCEAAISLASRGAEVTQATMESAPQQERLGSEVGERIAGWLAGHGVALRTDAELERIESREPLLVTLSGEGVEADVVVLALGVERNSEIAAAAGIELEGDLIPTDERMATALPDLLATGDVAFAFNPTAGRRLAVEHWGEALTHGEIAGAALAGDPEARWANAPGFWSGLGPRTIKQVAWGDGFDRVEVTDHDDDAFTARYVAGDELVGVLTHEADDDYESGRKDVEARRAWR